MLRQRVALDDALADSSNHGRSSSNSNSNINHGSKSYRRVMFGQSMFRAWILPIWIVLFMTFVVGVLYVIDFENDDNDNSYYRHHRDVSTTVININRSFGNNEHESMKEKQKFRRDIHQGDHSLHANTNADVIPRKSKNEKKVNLKDIIKVPLPIFDLSLPYSNGITSVLGNFFQCQVDAFDDKDFSVAQTYCSTNTTSRIFERNDLCGQKIMQSYRESNNDFLSKMLEGGHSYYGGFEISDSLCLFPQILYLNKIHQKYPEATFLINTQSSDSWYQSISDSSVLGAEIYGYTPLEVRLGRCIHKLGLADDFEGNSTANNLMAWHESQIEKVRDFVNRYKSHTLIEIDVSTENVGSELSSRFLKRRNDYQLSANSQCRLRKNLEPEITRIQNATQYESTLKTEAIPFSHDFKVGHKVSLDFRKQSQEKLLVPTPIFLLGFPKAGTTSIDNFFRCQGISVSHNLCNDNPLNSGNVERCGRMMKWNLLNNRPLFDYTGQYHVYTQFEDPDICFFPQITHLQRIHEEFPNATFVLNLRNFTGWVESVKRWRHKSSGFLPLNVRLTRCFDKLSGSFETSITNSSNTDGGLVSMYITQVQQVRNFVMLHPSHRLVEINIDDNDTGDFLREIFLGSVSDKVRSDCWGKRNQNKVKLVTDSGYDSGIIPEAFRLSHHPRDEPYIVRSDSILQSAKRFKVEIPILVVGLPFLPIYPIDYFFTCMRSRSVSDFCHGDAFGLSESSLCSDLFESNLKNGWKFLYFTGENEVYTRIHSLDKCFFPQLTQLQIIHDQYPNATLLLNTIDTLEWTKHVNKRDGNFVKIDACLQNLVKVDGIKHSENIIDRMVAYYDYHMTMIRSFAQQHPSHKLIEIDVSNSNDEEVERYLREIFYGEHNWIPKKPSDRCYSTKH